MICKKNYIILVNNFEKTKNRFKKLLLLFIFKDYKDSLRFVGNWGDTIEVIFHQILSLSD